jgi:hypothetical protein
LGHFHGHNAETGSVDHLEDIPDVAGAHGVGLNHGKSAIGHNAYVLCVCTDLSWAQRYNGILFPYAS